MAYSPAVRARIVAALICGDLGWDGVVVDGRKVSKATLSAWMAAARGGAVVDRGGKSAAELRDVRRASPAATKSNRTEPAPAYAKTFDQLLEEFLMATIAMDAAIARTCAEPDFIRANPHGVNELGQSLRERADKLVSFARGRQRA